MTTLRTALPARATSRTRAVLALLIAVTTLLATAVPAAAAGRPGAPPPRATDVVWTPPSPAVNGNLVTVDGAVLGYATASQSYRPSGTGVYLPESAGPLRMSVEREVVAVYGEAALRAAVEQFNSVAGTRFRVVLDGIVDDGVREPATDGVNRLFFDDATCRGDALAWSHLTESAFDHAYGAGQLSVSEFEIGLCRRLGSSKLHSTVGHELLHVAGMGHLCNHGESCWREGMHHDNTCRLMYPSAKPCQEFNHLDAMALAYLHPAAPRLSGPGRAETSARVSYASRVTDRAATEVVLVDGDRDPDLAIQAAALAGVEGAPLLLVATGRSCTEGAWADELNRVAATGATTYLVGPMHRDCAADLRGWGLDVVELDGARAVANAIAGPPPAAAQPATDEGGGGALEGLLGGGGSGSSSDSGSTTVASSPSGTMLLTRAAAGGSSPDALAAAAVAGRLNAPVMYSLEGTLTTSTQQWLDRRGNAVPERAIVVGGPKAVPTTVVAELESYGIAVERISGPNRIETSLALANFREAFSATPDRVLIAAADRWADTVSASALGGTTGSPVVLVWAQDAPDPVVNYVRGSGAAAWIVGGPGVVHDTTQFELGQAVTRLP